MKKIYIYNNPNIKNQTGSRLNLLNVEKTKVIGTIEEKKS